MCYNHIAVLADLQALLVNGTCNPSRGLAELTAPLLVEDRFKTGLYKIADRRPLAAALLWSRIGDQLSGQARIEALTLAAALLWSRIGDQLSGQARIEALTLAAVFASNVGKHRLDTRARRRTARGVD